MKTYTGAVSATFVVEVPIEFKANNRVRAKKILLELLRGMPVEDDDGVEHILPAIVPDPTPNMIHAVGMTEDGDPDPFMMEDLSLQSLEDWQSVQYAREAVAVDLLNWINADPENKQELIDVVISDKTPAQAQAFVDQLKLPGNMAKQEG